MWGFVLPTLHKLISLHKNGIACDVTIQSSGPIMDNVFQKILAISSFDAKIISNDRPNGSEIELVKRWDHWVAYLGMQQSNLHTKPIWKYIDDHEQIKTYLEKAIQEIRTFLLPLLQTQKLDFDYSGHYILLKRADPPEFYKSGEAELKSYGSSRRSIRGLNQAATFLNQNNIPVKIFESGNHSILDQIQVFNQCKGVIGVRGAEFANLVWMNPGKKVVMVLPSNMYSYSIPVAFGEIMNLDFHTLKSYGGKHSILEPEVLSNILEDKV